ncbi:MAG: single-stranded DNA-binding protein [Planctomycetes bacterium]|nr:single-stranded DNA-binding protein [Planctomycetota bacterium]
MSSYNRIVLMGNLTRDPELSYTPANTAVCKFGIATNRKWRDRDGGEHEDVCFVDCTLFGRRGEAFKQYMAKGRSVLIEGRLQLNRWTTPEGDKRSKHEVLVDSFEFVGGPPGGAQGGAPGGAQRGAPAGAAAADGAVAAGEPPAAVGPGYDSPPPPTDDDIPF